MSKTEIDEDEVERLYMAGLSDSQIGRKVGRSAPWATLWRNERGYAPNAYLFAWQSLLSPRRLAQIPVKYRNPKLREKVG